MSRLLEEYKKKIKPNLMKELGLKNIYSVPEIKKIVININLCLSLITQCPYGCLPKYFTIVYNLIPQNLFYTIH